MDFIYGRPYKPFMDVYKRFMDVHKQDLWIIYKLIDLAISKNSILNISNTMNLSKIENY